MTTIKSSTAYANHEKVVLHKSIVDYCGIKFITIVFHVMATPNSNELLHNQPLDSLYQELLGLIYSVRDLENRITAENLSVEQVKATFAEMYPPDALFSEAIQSLFSIYTSLRYWLNSNGAELVKHSTRRIFMTLAPSVYTDEEEKNAANELKRSMTKRRTNSARSPNEQVSHAVSGAGSSHQAGPRNDTTRTAHNIAIRFRSNQFSGDIGESWNECVA